MIGALLETSQSIVDLGFQPLVIVAGPTASGKTQMAIDLAQAGRRQGIEFEIISVDSRQVYIGMDVGTGKDSQAYSLAGVPVHMLDIAQPAERIRVADYCQIAGQLLQTKRPFILSGGSHFYLKTLLFGLGVTASIPSNHQFCEDLERNHSADQLAAWLSQLNPHNFARTDLDSVRRLARSIEISLHGGQLGDVQIPPDYLHGYLPVGIYTHVPPDVLRQKIYRRLVTRLEAGMIEEARRLTGAGLSLDELDRFGLEYAWLARFLAGECDEPALLHGLSTDIGRFAKSQRTFIRHLNKAPQWQQWFTFCQTQIKESLRADQKISSKFGRAEDWWSAHGQDLFRLHPYSSAGAVPDAFPNSQSKPV